MPFDGTRMTPIVDGLLMLPLRRSARAVKVCHLNQVARQELSVIEAKHDFKSVISRIHSFVYNCTTTTEVRLLGADVRAGLRHRGVHEAHVVRTNND